MCDETELKYVAHYLKRPIKVDAYKALNLKSTNPGVAAYVYHNKPQIKQLIRAIMEEELMDSVELLRDTHANATANLANCMATRKIEYTPRVKKPLGKLIDEIEANVMYERNCFRLLGDVTKKKQKAFDKWVKEQNVKIMRYEQELKLNPKASRIVYGETVLKDEHYLDMKKVIEYGYQIEKVEHDKNGRLKVSLVSATAAKERLFKVAGLYEKDNAQKAPVMNIIIQSGDEDLGKLNTIEI